MKNLKYLFLTLLGALAFVACSEDTREADWSGIQGDGTYFAVDAQTSYKLEANQSSVKIPVMRSFTEGVLATLVSLTDESGIFVADSNARFADGEAEGSVEIVFNFDDIEAGVAYQLTLALLDDTHKSGYGERELTFTLMYDPWTYVGKGYFRDDIISSNFSILTPYAEVLCDIYESDVTEDVYRLANVYNSPLYSAPMFGVDPSVFGGNVREGYIVLNCQNPDKVYMVESEMGLNINSAYGWMTCGSICPENGFEKYNYYGKMVNGVITFDTNGLFLFLPDYSGGYALQANYDGMTRVVMPGASAIEPVVKVEYEGVMIDPDSNASAVFNLELNADAEVVYFAAVDAASDLNAALAGMMDGSVECEAIYESGEFTYAITEPGQYVGIFLPATKDGSAVGTPVGISFEYSTGGVTPSQFAVEFTVEADETFAYLAVSPNTDKFNYYWDFMSAADYEKAVGEFGSIEAYCQAFFEYVAQLNSVSVPVVMEAYASQGLVEETLVEGLEAGTTYVAYAFCVDMTTGAARSVATLHEFSTLESQPLEADYEALLGTWTVTSSSSEEGKTPISFDLTFSQKKSNMMYDVTGWTGIPYPIVAYYQAGDAETDALFYFTEQATNTTFSSQYGTIRVCFFGRYYEPEYSQNIFMGEVGAPCLVGGLSSATAGNIEPWSVTIEGTKYNYIGADLFGLILDGDYAGQGVTFAEDLTVGPYTMEKAAATQSFEPKAQFSTGMSLIREANLRNVDGKLLRREFLSKHNCVMIR